MSDPSPFPAGAFTGLDPTKAGGSRRAYLADAGKEGTYWMKIDALKIFQTKVSNATMAAADLTNVKTISAHTPNTAHRECEEVGNGVQKTIHNFFSDFISNVCWCLLKDQFGLPYEQGGCNAKSLKEVPPSGVNPANGQYMKGPMEVAAEYVFGPEQPFTNTVVEIKVRRKPQKSPNDKVYYEADWGQVVPDDILAETLSPQAKAAFPKGYFDAYPQAQAAPAQAQPMYQQAPAQAAAVVPTAPAQPAFVPQQPAQVQQAAPAQPTGFRFGKK